MLAAWEHHGRQRGSVLAPAFWIPSWRCLFPTPRRRFSRRKSAFAALPGRLTRGGEVADIVQREAINPLMPRPRVVAVTRLKLLQETDHSRSSEAVAQRQQALTVNLILSRSHVPPYRASLISCARGPARAVTAVPRGRRRSAGTNQG